MPTPRGWTYIRLGTDVRTHRKFVGLSDAAFRLLVVDLIAWSGETLADGFVPAAYFERLGTPETRDELFAAGLVELVDSGVQVHDYTQVQRTRAVAERSRKGNPPEKGRSGGQAKAAKSASKVGREWTSEPAKSASKSGAHKDPAKSGNQSTEVHSSEVQSSDTTTSGLQSLLNIPGSKVFRAPKPSKRAKVKALKSSDGRSEEPLENRYEATKRRVMDNITQSREKGTK